MTQHFLIKHHLHIFSIYGYTNPSGNVNPKAKQMPHSLKMPGQNFKTGYYFIQETN